MLRKHFAGVMGIQIGQVATCLLCLWGESHTPVGTGLPASLWAGHVPTQVGSQFRSAAQAWGTLHPYPRLCPDQLNQTPGQPRVCAVKKCPGDACVSWSGGS